MSLNNDVLWVILRKFLIKNALLCCFRDDVLTKNSFFLQNSSRKLRICSGAVYFLCDIVLVIAFTCKQFLKLCRLNTWKYLNSGLLMWQMKVCIDKEECSAMTQTAKIKTKSYG